MSYVKWLYRLYKEHGLKVAFWAQVYHIRVEGYERLAWRILPGTRGPVWLWRIRQRVAQWLFDRV